MQLDNTLEIEYFDDLINLRRQEDTLSQDKLRDLIQAYNDYHANNIIIDDKQVYVDKAELKSLNPRL